MLAPIPPAARTSLAQPARADPARKRNLVLLAHRLQSEGSSTTTAAGGFRPAPPDQPRSGKPTDIRRTSRVLIPATEQPLAIQIKEPATKESEGFSTSAAPRMKLPELEPYRGTQERHPPSPPQLQGRGMAKGGTAPPTGEIQLRPKGPPIQKKLLVPNQQLLLEFRFPPPPPEQTKVLSKGTASHGVTPREKDTQCAKPRVQLFDFLPPITSAPKKAKARSYGEEVGRKLIWGGGGLIWGGGGQRTMERGQGQQRQRACQHPRCHGEAQRLRGRRDQERRPKHPWITRKGEPRRRSPLAIWSWPSNPICQGNQQESCQARSC
ncbi:uncharacterized protein LOC128348799 isoform X2 [Hemicordylus capensis]|uniref:uncharacterized protein LOC128348799 isoform X2 n=1 Tax=Hemicordylus capensis TaxID=884348 RepID=UPI0023044D36|nr:uncharacterized protein LOC128348799 isoform X2 [Hemicordylus capensis]